MHQHEGAPDPRQTPPRTPPTRHPRNAHATPLHNSHVIPRGVNLDDPHKPHDSAIVNSKFERLTGKLRARLCGNHHRNAGGQGAAVPRPRRRSSARRPLKTGPFCRSDSSRFARSPLKTSPYCRSDSSRFARTTMPMRVTICSSTQDPSSASRRGCAPSSPGMRSKPRIARHRGMSSS